MCNCGHEVDTSEADRLKKTGVTTAVGAVCLSGLPAALGISHGHPAAVAGVVGLQAVLLVIAVRALLQRNAILRNVSHS